MPDIWLLVILDFLSKQQFQFYNKKFEIWRVEDQILVDHI